MNLFTFLSMQKLCATASRCAKLQKNTHTTGRKSHARLLKEMVINILTLLVYVKFIDPLMENSLYPHVYSIVQEDRKKGKVHRIELWDAAHKKKNGRYSNNKVKIVMVSFSAFNDLC